MRGTVVRCFTWPGLTRRGRGSTNHGEGRFGVFRGSIGSAHPCVSLYLPVLSRSYKKAVEWYEAVLGTNSEDAVGEYDPTSDCPSYEILAKMANMYLTGDEDLDKDPSYAGSIMPCSIARPLLSRFVARSPVMMS